MKLETIYLKANTPFSKAIQAWCSENANEVVHTKERYELSIELFDSLLIAVSYTHLTLPTTPYV